MPRIRKKTSNRKSTNDRAKVRHKIKESRKKKAKAAAKNPQWKSKKPKDPGIPNDFPYKDQILGEVAEQRRQAAEEKQRKKEEKQRILAKARAIARGEEAEDDVEEESESEEEDEGPEEVKNLNVGAESIAGLSAKLLNAEIKPRPRVVQEVEEQSDTDDEAPVLINRDLPNLQSVLDKADVILEVLDARDPLAFRSEYLEQLITKAGKKILLVVNKIDTTPREAICAWSSYLRAQHPTLLFRSASLFLPEGASSQPKIPSKGKGKSKAKIPSDDAFGVDSILSCLGQWAKEKEGEEPLTVAVIGVTNVGKSSLVNSLPRRAAFPIYTLASSSRGPTTTELPQETILEVEGKEIVFVDTPGLSFDINEEEESTLESIRSRDILLRSKGRIDRLKDLTPPIRHIVSRANTEDLMLLYSLPAFAKEDPTAFLSGVARSNQLVKKRGELDLTGAARIVLRDWSTGKFSRYTTAPPTTATDASQGSETSENYFTGLYARDEAILAAVQTRKEMRKAKSIVRFSAGSIDRRKVDTQEPWKDLQGDESQESDDAAEDDDVEGMDVDGEEEESEEEDDEEEDEEGADEEEDEEDVSDEGETEEDEEVIPPPSISNKQKRKRGIEKSDPLPPSKKVAFGPPPKGSKEARKQGPLHGNKGPIEASQQKKPSKPVQASGKEANKAQLPSRLAPSTLPAKSALEAKFGKASLAAKKPSGKAKIANVPTKKPRTNGKKGGNEPEVYDFGKFF